MATFHFSALSLRRLLECHPDLQAIARELIKEIDVVVLCGHRGEMEQNVAYHDGKSKLRYPHSKHNKTPSLAIDLGHSPLRGHV